MKLNEKIISFGFMGVLLLMLSMQSYASKDKHHKNHLHIVNVEVNSDAGTFVIHGKNFDRKKHDDDDDDKRHKHDLYKKVVLGEHEIVVESWTNTMITAFLPPGILPGDYRLHVMNKKGESHDDSYDLTIGAVGPKGDKGDKGDTGSQGPAGVTGPVGLTGATGPKGMTGATGLQGPRGFNGAQGQTGATGPMGPVGPQGIPGIIGLANQRCPSGDEVTGFDNAGNIICNTVVTPTTCTSRVFTFSVNSTEGSSFSGASWPGTTLTQRGSTTPNCTVTTRSPSGNVSLVGSLGDSWRVTSRTGYSSCFGIGGEDGDGVNTPNCSDLTLSIGSVLNGRPSCSNSLCTFCTGRANSVYRVQCLQ